MKAVLLTKYGGPEVLKVMEVATPKPKENEVLIKIHASAVNHTDPVFRKGKPFISRLFTGLFKPKYQIPGDVLAGEIRETGQAVTRFKTGDRVYGYSTNTLGAHAEYKCLPENSAIVHLPAGISYEEAAGIVDGGLTALVFLRDKGKIKIHDKVLIYGASGSIGTAAVQIAVHYGAEVTGVCGTANLEMVQSLGATKVIDYTQNDFTMENEKYDMVFDTVAKKSFSACRKVLTENGIYLSTFPKIAILLKALFQSKNKGKRAFFIAAGLRPVNEKITHLNDLSELLKAQKIKTIIDKKYSLNEIAEAHQHVETGHKKGNVVISLCE